MTDSTDLTDRERVEQYAKNHPNASVAQILASLAGDLEAGPETARALVEDVVTPDAVDSDPMTDGAEGPGDTNRKDDSGNQAQPSTTAHTHETDNTDDSYVDDPEFEGDDRSVREHYDRVAPVYATLAHLGDEHPGIAFAGNAGWYHGRPVTDVDQLEAGWDTRSRALTIARDWETIVQKTGGEGKSRTIYNVASWKTSESVFTRRRRRRDPAPDEAEWEDGQNPLPDYKDLRGFGFWVDLDLADHLKPQRGELGDDTRTVVETAQERMIEEVATLYGVDDEAVYALDSGGGAYIYGPPEAALPIAEAFDEDERQRIFDELRTRLKGWAAGDDPFDEGMWTRICDAVDGAEEVLDPDWMQNKNRQSKAPLAIHQDHDVVVTPLRDREPETGRVTSDVDYTPTLVSGVDEDLVAQTTAWAQGLTAIEHTDAVGVLVDSLWPDYADEGDGWQDTLSAWLDAQQRDEQREGEYQHEAPEELPSLTDVPLTTQVDDVYRAIDQLDIERVAGRTIVRTWTDEDSRRDSHAANGKRDFVPTWGTSSTSGTANYVDLERGTWVDTGSGDYGTAVEMALISEESWSRGDIARGEDWARGVDHLRRLGFEIPVHLPDARQCEDETMPYWAIRRAALVLDVVDEDDLVTRDGEDGGSYRALPGAEAYNATLQALEELGFEHGREYVTPNSREGDETDPTDLDVTLEPESAWRAARTVTPDDLDTDAEDDIELAVTAGGDAWTCPHCDGAVDVVRAVALDRGLISCCEDPLPDAKYDDAYNRARYDYGAPLPEYVTAATATDNWQVIRGAIEQLEHWHLDTIRSRVSGAPDDPDVVAEIDPCWEYSASGERVIAFESGGFYCRKHERSLDPIRLVALEEGLIPTCDAPLEGEDFRRAYHIAREQRGAPLPEWTVDAPEHIPVLPPAEDLLSEFDAQPQKLDDAREDVEELYRDLVDGGDQAMLRVLPALGKTTSVIKNASEYPALYLAPRKELMADAADKAEEYGVSYRHLPIFAEWSPEEAAITEGAEIVRDQGLDLLRNRWQLFESVEADLVDEEDDEDDDSAGGDVDPDLDRESCPTANGEHGEDWALAVHVAKRLGYSPRDIHTRAEALFGAPLPCQCEDHDHEGPQESVPTDRCPYSKGWDVVTDPDRPVDLLIGHYVHGHVGGARSYYTRDGNDRTQIDPRAVAVDEFPGLAYAEEFGEEFLDYATWLGRALRDDVDDREDLFEADLWDDDWVRAWLRGDGTQIESVATLEEYFARLEEAMHIVDAAQTTLDEYRDSAEDLGIVDPLERLVDAYPRWDRAFVGDVWTDLRDALEDVPRDGDRTAVNHYDDVFLEPLSELATQDWDDHDLTDIPIADAPLSGDLKTFAENALAAARMPEREGGHGRVSAARTALEGGDAGMRELAVHAHDGHAHPLAHYLLYGVIADGDREGETGPATRLETDAFDFEGDDGTALRHVPRGRDTVLVDRNHHGAVVHHPPEFAARDGSENPVIGLDATGREELWSLALGTDLDVADIHDTMAARRRFLRETLNLQVVQTSDAIKSYEGSTDAKNFDADVALVQEVAKEIGTEIASLDAGAPDGGRGHERQNQTLTPEKPATITTKCVREAIEDRIDTHTSAVDHYGNVVGSNELADHRLAVLLGCQHYGDAAVEKVAAVAGEQVARSGYGHELDYGSPVANAFRDHMREDQTLQAILRFARDERGAVVFAHTAALREDLPVVADAQVVRAFSEQRQDVANAAKQFRGQPFTGRDLVDDVDCSRRTIRRALNEFAELGYLEKAETPNGYADEFSVVQEPGTGQVELPTVTPPAEDPGQIPLDQSYTWSVRVGDEPTPPASEESRGTPLLPAPTTANGGDLASHGAD